MMAFDFDCVAKLELDRQGLTSDKVFQFVRFA
jgi:hypothetical protein